MDLPRISPVHRPDVPAELLEADFPAGHLDDAAVLADLGMTGIVQAAEHYRARLRRVAGQELCRRLLATHGRTDPQELEEIRRNVFTLRAHMHVKHDYGPRVDWTTVLNGDIESNVAINHHAHIGALAMAWRQDREDRYAAHAVELLRSWFEQSPAPTSEARLQWRTLEVGGRLSLAWPVLGVCLHDYEGLTDRDVFDLIRWTWLSVRHLRRFVGPPNNWLQVESIGALCGLALLGDVPAARGWADLFWRRLAWINEHHFLPDGMQAENSPGYHVFPWWRLYMGGIWIELFGGELPAGYWDEQVQRAQPLWMLRQPDGALPALSDCGPQPTRADRLLDFVREHRPGSVPDVAALGRRGELPAEHRVCHLPYAGYTVARTGWGHEAEFVLFDHGFYGTNHQHEDKLTFLYAAHGRMLVGDAGIYRYSFDEWEDYYRGAAGHNVILIDGKQQARSMRAWQGRYETLPDADCRHAAGPDGAVVMSGWYRDGYIRRLHHLWQRADRSDELATLDESVRHHRVLVWLPGRGLLVIDRLIGDGSHRVDRIFHLEPFAEPPDRPVRFVSGRLVLTGQTACLLPEGGVPGVLLVAGEPGASWTTYCGSRDPVRGWTSLYGEQPSHDLWLSSQASRRGGPATLATWIQPWRREDGPARAAVRVESTENQVTWRVDVEDWGGGGIVRLSDLGLERR